MRRSREWLEALLAKKQACDSYENTLAWYHGLIWAVVQQPNESFAEGQAALRRLDRGFRKRYNKPPRRKEIVLSDECPAAE